MKGLFRDRKGFTLIEVMVALAILAAVILPFTGMFSSAALSNYKTVGNTKALTIARDIMDRIKAGDINKSNLEKEKNNYETLYGVEIKILILGEDVENSLQKVKVYVSPHPGKDPEKEGIMLSSYFFSN